MRRAFLLALAVLPLAAFDCGGSEPAPYSPYSCTISVRGELSEELWCVVALSRPNPDLPHYLLVLSAYRGQPGVGMEEGAGVGIDFAVKPVIGAAYGWDASVPVTSVDSGTATRYDAAWNSTHQAAAPLGVPETGKLSLTFNSLPAADVGPDTVNVHGTFTATLPPTSYGTSDVTFTATF